MTKFKPGDLLISVQDDQSIVEFMMDLGDGDNFKAKVYDNSGWWMDGNIVGTEYTADYSYWRLHKGNKMESKEEHKYANLVAALNSQRNQLIADYRLFRQNRVNRLYMDQSHFAQTRNRFKAKIKEIDLLLPPYKKAIALSKKLDVEVLYDHERDVFTLNDI